MTNTLIAALQRQLGATLMETHISWVLLDGVHAWKIKKPVQLGFLDFSDLQERHRLCLEELRLNRRLAPDVYLDVVPIGGTPAHPVLGLAPRPDTAPSALGEPIEYALRMKQFAPGALFIERLHAGTLTGAHLEAMARKLAAFHQSASVAPANSPYGTPASVVAATQRVLAGLHQQGQGAACTSVAAWLNRAHQSLEPIWMQRRQAGRVVEGHGDLHLGNLVVLGKPGSAEECVTAFDCIEFDPGLRWGDAMSDVAFLAMDLRAHGWPQGAYRFLNAYLDASGDHEGLPVCLYYMVYRALVRALVAGIARSQSQGEARSALAAPDYLAVAQQLVREASQPGRAHLCITHGLSGSGKTVASQAWLQTHGAIRLRSDVERKRLLGRGGDLYTPAASQQTYARLLVLARLGLEQGYPVIVDAAFLRRSDRQAFHALAAQLEVPFSILHCQAPGDELRARLVRRQQAGQDESDADLAVLAQQMQQAEPLGADEQPWVEARA